MDDAYASIRAETPEPMNDLPEIDFIDEIIFNHENKEYKIKYGTKDNDTMVVFRVSLNPTNYDYYQHSVDVREFHDRSKLFSMHKTAKEIIGFLKKTKFEVDIKKTFLFLKYTFPISNGKNEIISFQLNKDTLNDKDMIKSLVEEIKTIKNNTKEEISTLKQKHELEIKKLQENISKDRKEIENLNKDILSNQQALVNSKEETKKLSKEITNLKKIIDDIILAEKSKINFNDFKTVDSINTFNFIFNYIRQNDPIFNFSNLKLLYRGSRDGDRTKICHELCDNKQNVLIVIKSDRGNIFGGYSKIGFKCLNGENFNYLIDNNSFLFSINLNKIYPVINNKKVICHAPDILGLCFASGFVYYDGFMQRNDNYLYSQIKQAFNGLNSEYEMNGGYDKFKCKELEVYQLL